MSDIKVYFAGSITGDRSKAGNFKYIISYMQQLGVKVLTEHFGLDNPNMRLAEIINKKYEDLTAEDIERQDTAWIDECTHVVAEISAPSTGTGREVEYARSKHLYGHVPAKVLCLYAADSNPTKMITGMTPERYPNVTVRGYKDLEDVHDILKDFLK